MRATLAVLLIALCATVHAQPQPDDRVPFEHWAYDAFALLNDVLDGAMIGSYWDEALIADPPLTRYQCAIGVLQTLDLLLKSDVTAETPDVEGYGYAWHELAMEFLPEVIAAGEPAGYLAPAEPTPPWPSPRPEEALPINLAIRDMRAVPHDHWLYPEAQRVLWAAAGMIYSDAARAEHVTSADPVPLDHWAYQSLARLAPLAYRGRDIGFDRAFTHYEIAILPHTRLRELAGVEQPTRLQEDSAITLALLALEFWPELQDLARPEVFHAQWERPEDRGRQYPLVPNGEEITEDHWLYPIVARVLEIAGRNG